MYEIFDSAEANEEIFNYYCTHDNIEIQDLLGGSEEPIAIFFYWSWTVLSNKYRTV